MRVHRPFTCNEHEHALNGFVRLAASRQEYSASFTVHTWQRWHKKALKEQNKLRRALCALAASDASDEYSGWGVPEAEWAKSNPSRQQSTAGRSRAVFSDYDYSVIAYLQTCCAKVRRPDQDIRHVMHASHSMPCM